MSDVTGVVTGCLGPELSAERVLSRPQAACLIALATVVACLAVVAPAAALMTAVVFCAVWCLLISLHQLAVAVVGSRQPIGSATSPNLAEAVLPSYTILVPLYREANLVDDLLLALRRLDYPEHLLEVRLLVEATDAETLDALRRQQLSPPFELVVVPAGVPRTKPRACNFGLDGARGELAVIFDAEDRPESDQLKKAAAAFSAAPDDVACLQARLDFWNPDTNLLTRYAAARFSAKFGLAMVGLQRLGAPMPLGGTSNYLRVSVLRELGAWDQFNVTEDADLGIRLARAGYRTHMLDSTTYEEANPRLANWLRQQSRWMKGYLQTWLVHVRHPICLARELGVPATIHFHLMMFSTVLPTLLAPLRWLATLAWILVLSGVLAPFLPVWLLTLCAGSVLFGMVTAACVYALALHRRGHDRIIPFCALFPACELIKSIAAVRAIAQLVTRPSYWEKTVHGFDLGHGDPRPLNRAGRSRSPSSHDDGLVPDGAETVTL